MQQRCSDTLAFLLIALVFLISGCIGVSKDSEAAFDLKLPHGFDPMPVPEDNALTEKRVALGRKLFFDKALSHDSTLSCGFCHRPKFAFADNMAITPGIKGRRGFRNAPSLANVAWHPYMLKDGGTATLETQVLVPIEDPDEMGFNMYELVMRLKQDPEYQRLSREAYGEDIDAFSLTRALGAFQRSLVSGNSRYDQIERGEAQATAEELLGREIFELHCQSCHSGFNFTNYAFENNGTKSFYPDSGRARITFLSEDNGKFKVPSLRNVGLTAPYMHDGSFRTLASVIAHYNNGGKGHPNQSELVKPLNLSEEEQAALLNFLQSLTDESFVKYGEKQLEMAADETQSLPKEAFNLSAKKALFY